MTLDELLASIRCPPHLALHSPGRPLDSDPDYITLYALFKGPDSRGEKEYAMATSTRTLRIGNLNDLSEGEQRAVIVSADSALRELWMHEYNEWFTVDGVPVHPPHHADGSFA